LPVREPVTLPCGKSLCKICLPPPYTRTHISYPATESRSKGFQCPFSDCGREHAVEDSSPDVILCSAVEIMEAKLTNSPTPTGMSTSVTVEHCCEQEHFPASKDFERKSSPVPLGGKFAATFALAREGLLGYNDGDPHTIPATLEETSIDSSVLVQVKEALKEELSCQVCYALFYDPVTTPCGHTYCRPCLQRVLDYAKYCPTCRRSLSMEPMVYPESYPSNTRLKQLIEFLYADLLEGRKQTMIAEALQVNDGNSINSNIPIFVCTLSFPSVPTFLHVFEPRYRLMMRRALEGDRTFGMISGDHSGMKALGTILRIVNIQFMEDGRSLVECVGVSRFRILTHDILDGYIVANIQRINDVSIAEEEALESQDLLQREPCAPPSPSLDTSRELSVDRKKFPSTREEIETTSTRDLLEFGVDFVQRMQDTKVRWLSPKLLSIYGGCPRDPAVFPWWVANILPISHSEKYRLLGIRSVRERLKVCCGWILDLENNTWYVVLHHIISLSLSVTAAWRGLSPLPNMAASFLGMSIKIPEGTEARPPGAAIPALRQHVVGY